ncbi:transglycosylase SLT domain-containing protein, partial [Flavobacterium sp.]|uniref:transglycosylase SLT domain-containing protein n=1 Tax=Flavobacterium sp. TaxID=239 RepID=UPI0037BF09D8
PEAAIKKAASVTGMNADTMTAFARIESSLNPNATNRVSSATGLFQITSTTWKGLMRKYAQQYNIPPDAQPTDPYYNSLLGSLYAKENLKAVSGYQSAGVREDVALYLAHHFGASGGNRIIKAMSQNPNARINEAVSADAYRSNSQELGNKTVGQYVDFLSAKLTKAGSTLTASQGNTQPPKAQVINPASIPAGDSPYPVDNSTPSAYTNQPPYMKPKVEQASPLRPTLPPSDPAPQPSQAMNLNKSESLLSGMSETLLAIKKVLMSIDSKTGTDSQKTSDKQDKQENPTQSQQQAINVDSNRMPSQTSVSMSRRPVPA